MQLHVKPHSDLPGHLSIGFTFVLDEGGRSTGREGCDPLRHSQNEHIGVHHGELACCLLKIVNTSISHFIRGCALQSMNHESSFQMRNLVLIQI